MRIGSGAGCGCHAGPGLPARTSVRPPIHPPAFPSARPLPPRPWSRPPVFPLTSPARPPAVLLRLSQVPQYSSEELPDKAERALELLEASFEWAREVNPSQPLTAGVWAGSWARETDLSPIQRFQLDSSDIITFHNYGSPADVQTRIGHLRRYNRPILCTEYMARGAGSTFEGVLPILKNENIGAYNWCV